MVRLLDLPFVAAREVFGEFSNREQFLLSLCSKRSHNLVKLHCKKSKAFLRILKHSENYTHFSLQTGEDGDDYNDMPIVCDEPPIHAEKATILGNRVSICLPLLATYWTNLELAVRTLLKYFYEIFGMNLHRMTIPSEFLSCIEIINNYQKDVPLFHVTVNGNDLNETDVVFQDFHVERLRIDASLPPSFFRAKKESPFFERISINKGRRIELVDMTALAENCQNLFIYESELTSENIYWFLKQWINGQFHRIKRLHVQCHTESNLATMVEGLEANLVPIPEGKKLRSTLTHTGRDRPTTCLRRADGVFGVYYLNDNNIFDLELYFS